MIYVRRQYEVCQNGDKTRFGCSNNILIIILILKTNKLNVKLYLKIMFMLLNSLSKYHAR